MNKVHLLFFLTVIVAASGCIHASDPGALSPDPKERALSLQEFNDTDMLFYSVKIENGSEDLTGLEVSAEFHISNGDSYWAESEYERLSDGSNGSKEYQHNYDWRRLVVENEDEVEVLNVSQPEHGVEYKMSGSNGTWLYSDFWVYYRPFVRSEFYPGNHTLRPDASRTAALLNGLVATASGNHPGFAAEDLESPEVTLRFYERRVSSPPDPFPWPFELGLPDRFQQRKRPGVVGATEVTPKRVVITVEHEDPDFEAHVGLFPP